MKYKSKPKQNTTRLGERFFPNYTLLYTLVFLLAAAVVFHYFLISGRVSVWYDDGKVQNYNTLAYIGIWFRDIFKNIFVNHSFKIPTYSFTLGYGGDIIKLLHFYVLGDPFNLLSVFVPSSKTVFLYHFLMILRLYLAGLAFSKLCFYLNENIDRYAVLAGALAYVFGGYALISAVRHPYFINPMIYMPILIIGMEKIRRKESPVLFVLGVFLSAVSNFYFLYQLVLFSALYLIGKMIFDRKKYTAKENVLYLLRLAAYALLGAAIAGAIFVPVLFQAINDPRMGVSAYVPLIGDMNMYKNLPQYLIASGGVPVMWTGIAMGGVLIPAAYTLFATRKKRTYLKVLVIALLVCVVTPFFGHVFNGMSYVSNRWIWILALALAYVIAVTVEDFARLKKKDYIICFSILAAYLVLCLVLKESCVPSTFVQLGIAAAVTAVIISLNANGKTRKLAGSVVLVGVLIGVGFNAYFLYSPNSTDFLDEYCYSKYFRESFEANEANLLNKKYKDDEFYRYSGTSLINNASLLNRQSSTQFYYSLSNPYIFEFLNELSTNATIGQRYYDLNDSTFLNTLANVKYYSLGTGDVEYAIGTVGGFLENPKFDTAKRVPYGYDKKKSKRWVFTTKGIKSKKTRKITSKKILGAFDVYENENFLPFGYTYSNTVSRSEFSKLNALEKQEALMQGVVLDKEVDTVKSITPETSSRKLNYKIKSLKGVTKQGDKFIATGVTHKITFEISGGQKNSETYFRFGKLKFKGIKPTDLYTDDKSVDPNDEYTKEDWNKLTPERQQELIDASNDFKDMSKLVLTTVCNGVKKRVEYRTEKNLYFEGRTDYMFNLNYSEEPVTTVTVKLPYRGIYSFDEIGFYCLPMDGYEKRVKALSQDVLTDVDFHDDNDSCSTNEVTGKISLKENKILCLTVPYSKDWTAYVDGKETEILRANTAFSGLALTKGEHKIRLVYRTSGFAFGIVLSVVGAVAFVALIVFDIIRKKRKRKVELSESNSD